MTDTLHTGRAREALDQPSQSWTEPTRLIGREIALDRSGLSRSQMYREIRRGRFPKPVKRGCRLLFVESEIEAYLHNLVRSRNDET